MPAEVPGGLRHGDLGGFEITNLYALDGHFPSFGDRTGFVVPTFGPHLVIQAYE